MPSPVYGPWWASITVWGVVNAVNVLQAAGFLSRVGTKSMATNHALGYAIVALVIPAAATLVGLVRAKAGWLAWAGPATFVAFVALMVVVDYAAPTEFRSPARPAILVPYLFLILRRDPPHGPSDVLTGSASLAGYGGDDRPASRLDGRRDPRRRRLIARAPRRRGSVRRLAWHPSGRERIFSRSERQEHVMAFTVTGV